MVLEGGLVELQGFFDLDFFGVVDLIFLVELGLDVEGMPGRLDGSKSAKGCRIWWVEAPRAMEQTYHGSRRARYI
jgi:hypothetical protein